MALNDYLAIQHCRESYRSIEQVGLYYIDDAEILRSCKRVAESIDALRDLLERKYERRTGGKHVSPGVAPHPGLFDTDEGTGRKPGS